MQQLAGELSLSPSDLSGFVLCAHLTQLERAVTRGDRTRPVFDDPLGELIRKKGAKHEASYLERLRESGKQIVTIPRFGDVGFTPDVARKRTEEAIRSARADVIYQAYLNDGVWHGVADFLERQPDGTYEPVETKLARTSRPDHLLQLSYYAEQLGRIQGRLPEHVHVEPGSGIRETFRTKEFAAYYRQLKKRFLDAIERSPPSYPWPCEHCSVCSWRRECHGQLVRDDHPILVPGLRRLDLEPLETAGITTLEILGSTPAESVLKGLRPATFETLRHQAELMLHRRRTGSHRVDLLPREDDRGFLLLPEPSPGDIWLDLEGYPFYEPARGLEYLFGYCRQEPDGELRYEALWAVDRATEKDSFERLIDRIMEHQRRYPGMHVYHYADYERSALRRLMGEHGTREEEVDELLRGHVLVDLYRVTRQALRASVDSYSIKKIEALYGFQRTSDVTGGNQSNVWFDQWLECGESFLLDTIALYNEEDCRSTVALHRWLLAQRPPDLVWRPPPTGREMDDKARALDDERASMQAELLQRSAREGDSRWLLAQLLDYHQREAKPKWWEWYHHLDLDDDERIEDSHTIGGLEPVGEPTPDKQSLVYTLAFPPQEHRIGNKGIDPAMEQSYDVKVDDDQGVVLLRRHKNRASEPLPLGLIPPGPIYDGCQREALLRFARSYSNGDGRYPALNGILERERPRVDLSLPLPHAALSLDRSHLVVQGPPGAGKTWQGAKMAVELMRAGRRVGVTALGHKAIHNLLDQIEREAARVGVRFRGRKKYSDEEDAYFGDCIDSSSRNEDLLDPELELLAGTSWLFSRPELDGCLDTLLVDEAGQMSLADTIASGTAAKSLILLGDPNQLPQVSQGAQPEAAKASVLQHLLGEHEVVPPEIGIFLAETWRLRPETCAFTSEAYYKGLLRPADVCGRRSLDAGNGLVLLPVEHQGCSQSSRREAEAVAEEIGRLLGTTFRTEDGKTRRLLPSDVLVVAPYNAQVRMLRSQGLPDGVRVGTVDKFQGQEAPVVIVSFASSSSADAPRGISFAFDRHRVNVATSRAQCRVVLVYEPRLLEAECRTAEHMRLMNAVCRFVELSAR